MVTSNLLIGSYESVPQCTLSITANAVVDATQSIAAGSYYLYDSSNSLSLLYQLRAALEAHTQITTATVWIGPDRKVHITTSPNNAAISFTGDTTARDLLGFTGNLLSASQHNASLISPLLWSPRMTEISEAPLGLAGRRVYDTVVGSSGTANVVATQHNSWVQNDFRWRNVPVARVWTTSELGGEWVKFYDQVLRKFRRFKLYRTFSDIAGDTTPGSLTDVLGPYKMRHEGGLVQWEYKRESVGGSGPVDMLSPIELPVVVVSEIGA